MWHGVMRTRAFSWHSHRRHSINITNTWVNFKAFHCLGDNVINSGSICSVPLHLNRCFVSNRHYGLDPSLCIDCSRFPRSQRLPLQEHVHTLRFSLLLLPCVLLDPVDEFLSRTRQGDMLDADIDSLLDVPVANSLVYYDTNCGFGNIVDDAGFAVVNFVGHAVVLSGKS